MDEHYAVDTIDGGSLTASKSARKTSRILSYISNAELLSSCDATRCPPSFSKRIFEFTDALEDLEINFNISVIPFYHHKEDLPRFPEFVNKLKSLDNAEIALHGLYHEDRNGVLDDFSHPSKSSRRGRDTEQPLIFQMRWIKSKNESVPPQWKLSRGL